MSKVETKAGRLKREDNLFASRTPAYRDGYADYVARIDEGGSFTPHAPRYDGGMTLQGDYAKGWKAADRALGYF